MTEVRHAGLSDTVAAVLPHAPSQWTDVSVQQLLTHTSGMGHWCDRPGFDPSTQLDPANRIALLLAAPVDDPATRIWRYSSPGYVVLSAVLERAAGRCYGTLVEEMIIDRLGLRNTSIGHAHGPGMARGYRGAAPVEMWNLHTMPGTGDIWSSAADVARFVTALHSGGLLPARAQAVIHDVTVPHQNSALTSGAIRTTGYGLGHFTGYIRGTFAYLHPGDNPGYQSLGAWVPATGTTIVALSNDELDDIDATVASALAESTP